MLDIGPAQGGSSISIGLGVRDSGKRATKVYSIEKGVGSQALKYSNDKGQNKNVLLENIKQYNLEKYSQILLGDVNEVHNQVDKSRPISLMFIDADGALDRDFSFFFNQMVDGAPVIIDDFANEFNDFARRKYLKWTTRQEMDNYVSQKGARAFVDLCPLGKEYTTYRFICYFMEIGLIERYKVIDSTFFGYKSTGARFSEPVHGSALRNIRKSILDEYYELNPSMPRS